MSQCNHDKCLRDGCDVCCYCAKELKMSSNQKIKEWPRLGIRAVRGGFGWQTIGDSSTDAIFNCLDTAEENHKSPDQVIEAVCEFLKPYCDDDRGEYCNYRIYEIIELIEANKERILNEKA